jgi:flavin-dependent dehydrogenase
LRRVEVIVLGGGPAGTATAMALARAGRAVAVLERSRYELPRVGECLPPEVRGPLTELGAWESFLGSGQLESPGIAAAWGHPEPDDQDFIVNPYGPGWHVDRRRFDVLLAEAAEAAGPLVLKGARPTRWARDSPAVWRVEALVDGWPLEIRAAALVDATGRSAAPARRLGSRRLVHDRLVGLWRSFPALGDGPGLDRRTWVEAVACGWWYSALLPDGRQVAALMTDADLLPAGAIARRTFWRRWLRQAPHTQARLGPDTTDIGLRIVSAWSARLDKMAGPRWLAVGDAAMAFDPLSAQGVMWALESGQAAARALDASLRGDVQAIGDYARQGEADYAAYLRDRGAVYGREHRWPDSPFWRRRSPRQNARDAAPLASQPGTDP